MDVEKVFHMTGGTGLTSYTNNSSLQKKASEMVKHITLEAVEEVYMSTKPNSLAIADLGCSSGPNALSIIRDIICSVHQTSRKMTSPPPELIQVFLNDLPTNDFNSIFKSLPDFSRQLGEKRGSTGDRDDNDHLDANNSMVLIGGYPGSFYGRLFPNNSLHFVYASYSLHWLSKVPPGIFDEKGKSINKGAIYISKNSPPEVSKAYLEQFKEDFSLFLRFRSEEVTWGGKMVLILVGREGYDHVDRGNPFLWEILYRSFAELVSKGVVEEEKLNSYEVHFYAPSKEEIENEVKKEGSFELDRFETFEIESEEKGSGISYGARVAMTVRAVQESMISQHFGEGILDNLFEIYGKMIDEEMAREKIRPVTFVLVLKKL